MHLGTLIVKNPFIYLCIIALSVGTILDDLPNFSFPSFGKGKVQVILSISENSEEPSHYSASSDTVLAHQSAWHFDFMYRYAFTPFDFQPHPGNFLSVARDRAPPLVS